MLIACAQRAGGDAAADAAGENDPAADKAHGAAAKEARAFARPKRSTDCDAVKRAAAVLHSCAAEACTKRIPSKLLMCLAHWRMVPAPLQREIYRTCRLARRSCQHEHWKAYDDAVAQAIATVREKEIKRQLRRDSGGDVLDLGPSPPIR